MTWNFYESWQFLYALWSSFDFSETFFRCCTLWKNSRRMVILFECIVWPLIKLHSSCDERHIACIHQFPRRCGWVIHRVVVLHEWGKYGLWGRPFWRLRNSLFLAFEESGSQCTRNYFKYYFTFQPLFKLFVKLFFSPINVLSLIFKLG